MLTTAADKTTVPFVKGLSCLEHVQSLFMSSRTSKKSYSKLSQKAHLTLLRELCVFMSVSTATCTVDKAMFALLVKDLSDSSISDKLLRTSLFLLIEAANLHQAKGSLHLLKDPLEDLRRFLSKEVSSTKFDSKQLLLWRSLYTVERLTPSYGGPVLEMDNNNAVLHRTLTALKYPSVKQKRTRSVLFMPGFSDKESPQQQLYFWSAVMSAVSRSGRALSASCWDNEVAPLKHHEYAPLMQHSLRVLLHVAASDVKDLQSRIVALLMMPNYAVSVNDCLCSFYYIRIVSTLAARAVPVSPGCLSMDELLSLFSFAADKFLCINGSDPSCHTSSAKAASEMIIVLVGRPYSATIMRKLQLKMLQSIASSLVFHLRSVTVDSVELSTLLKATRALGKFLLRRY